MLDVAKFGVKHSIFFHVGIPVSAEKNKRHTIMQMKMVQRHLSNSAVQEKKMTGEKLTIQMEVLNIDQ